MPHQPSYAKEPTSRGQQLLRLLPGTQDEIAQHIGCKGNTVHDWISGKKKPARRSREAISKAYPDITPDSWEQPAGADVPVTEQELADAEIDPSEVSDLDATNRLIREIRAAAKDPNITGTTRERLANRELVALKFRRDLTNNDAFMQDRIVGGHPDWVRVRTTMMEVVQDCDECSKKLITALEKLDDGSST